MTTSVREKGRGVDRGVNVEIIRERKRRLRVRMTVLEPYQYSVRFLLNSDLTLPDRLFLLCSYHKRRSEHRNVVSCSVDLNFS